MMNEEYINEHFVRDEVESHRWRFEPRLSFGQTATPLYRYFLTFVTSERRFVLSRQKVQPFESVADEEQIKVFRGLLTEEEVAACLRSSIVPPAPDDQIPF